MSTQRENLWKMSDEELLTSEPGGGSNMERTREQIINYRMQTRLVDKTQQLVKATWTLAIVTIIVSIAMR